MLLAAAACQVCAVVPGTQAAVLSALVGTTQDTSPTSEDPGQIDVDDALKSSTLAAATAGSAADG